MNLISRLIFGLFCTGFFGTTFAQPFTHADSLRGGYGSSRDWWDVKHYELTVRFDIENKSLSGSNRMTYSKLKNTQNAVLQFDLQTPMIVDSVLDGNQKLTVKKDGNAYFVTPSSTASTLTVYFHGQPKVAKMPPWDGGIIWSKDKNGKPWVSIACQNIGASVWFPCKDSQMDEPDSVDMFFSVPAELQCVSNGRLQHVSETTSGYKTFHWKVNNPINNYCIIPYIGDYEHIKEIYSGENGPLDIEFWFLKSEREKAKKTFLEIPKTLKAFEYWFGPYPFYNDGYKLVHAPFLGMEHQSAIAYGNGFQPGYKGTDLSGTGIGLKWDFIVVHETGHEWFGNNITSADIADMWVHEAFTNYSEVLYTTYHFSVAEGDKYCRGLRKNILNDKPIIGAYGVQNEGSTDMYYKGANMLHTIRCIVNNDSLFRATLRGMNLAFAHKIVTGNEVENYLSTAFKWDLKPVFDQYLRTTQIPKLEVRYSKNKVRYRWTNCIPEFNLPIRTATGIYPASTRWTKQSYSYKKQFDLHPNMYVGK